MKILLNDTNANIFCNYFLTDETNQCLFHFFKYNDTRWKHETSNYYKTFQSSIAPFQKILRIKRNCIRNISKPLRLIVDSNSILIKINQLDHCVQKNQITKFFSKEEFLQQRELFPLRSSGVRQFYNNVAIGQSRVFPRKQQKSGETFQKYVTFSNSTIGPGIKSQVSGTRLQPRGTPAAIKSNETSENSRIPPRTKLQIPYPIFCPSNVRRPIFY